MEKHVINKKNQTNGGYALYTAIILTGTLVLVSYITANLSIKSLILSTSQSDSHIAFYNADTGLECALYHEFKNGSISAFDITTPGTITCNSQVISTNSQWVQTNPQKQSLIGGGGLANPTSIFQLNLPQGCAIVTVTKMTDMTTRIESRGYNACSGSRRLERGITIRY